VEKSDVRDCEEIAGGRSTVVEMLDLPDGDDEALMPAAKTAPSFPTAMEAISRTGAS
jgi:hypothetical protein